VSSGNDGKSSIVELFIIVPIALLLALAIQAFLIKPFRIPSESMVPTLEVSQRVLVDRVTFRFSDPHRGDVVVFKAPEGAEENRCGSNRPGIAERGGMPCPEPTPDQSDENFIKRVVGVPGDSLSVREGRVYINGKRQDEPYVNEDTDLNCEICNLPRPITIPPDHFFMMGDNRGESADSREWGPVPEDWIVGNAFSTYWPPDRIGIL
jgi:signal peptidase I